MKTPQSKALDKVKKGNTPTIFNPTSMTRSKAQSVAKRYAKEHAEHPDFKDASHARVEGFKGSSMKRHGYNVKLK